VSSQPYSYASSLKSRASDEIINTYLIRPLAGIVVRIVFPTFITPNQLTLASTFAGIVAAWFFFDGTAAGNLIAGLFISLKDILDSADGQLARAKQQFSRAGRFLDSIGDFVVNVLAFGAIGFALHSTSNSFAHLALAALAFLGTTFRVSYHVFYHTSFLHLKELYHLNRVAEDIRDDDLKQDASTLRLQKIFQALYGWQDRMMAAIDGWCRGNLREAERERWFGDRVAVRLSGLLGLGTELFVLTMFSVVNALEMYLWVNVLALNAMWLVSILYRKFVLASREN
jgi:phosphatidylglycerophosphate synthase